MSKVNKPGPSRSRESVAKKRQPNSSARVAVAPAADISLISSMRMRDGCMLELGAVNILKEIPGLVSRKRAITSWLHTARELNPGEEIHEHILNYINNGQAHQFGIQVLNILHILRANDLGYENKPAWRNQARMLLWHGTKEDTLASILLNGLRLPLWGGQMFGPGIYFADRVTKSANYCESPMPNMRGYLLLCDVQVGFRYHAIEANHDMTEPPEKFDSVMADGWHYPNPTENVYYNGYCIPLGKTKCRLWPSFSSFPVIYNEYIVYSPEKVVPLYLVKFEYGEAPVVHVA